MQKTTIIPAALLICIIFLNLCNLCIGQINTPDTVITKHNDTLPGYSWQFSFVQLTDIHIGEGDPDGDYGSPGYNDTMPVGDVGDPAIRLRNSVNWINQNAAGLKIKFVIVTGDLTVSGEKSEFYKFKEIMDSLTIPYIPFIGNHDVWPYTSSTESPSPNGDSIFNTIFAAHFDTLMTLFPGWNDGTRLTQVWNSEESCYSYLQNFSFEYENYVFVLADFNTRKHAPLGEPGIGPEAQLMNFTGGTWQWFKQHIATHPSKGEKNMFLFSHHPVIKDIWAPYFSFSTAEYDSITQFLDIYKEYMGIWFAGHIHRVNEYGIRTWDLSSTVIQGVETAANKDYADGHFRIVKVWGLDSVGCPSAPVSSFMFQVSSDSLWVSFTDSSANATSWLWDFGDGNTDTTQNPIHFYDSAETYQVCLIATSSCGSDTSCKLITLISTAINNQSRTCGNQLKVYPNPSKASITLYINTSYNEELSFVLYDLLGNEVKRIENIITGETKINTSDLSNAMYFYKLTNKRELLKTGKLIIN